MFHGTETDAVAKILPHIEERLGHVAIDMGLLNPHQVGEINLKVASSYAGTGEPTSFRRIVVELGYLKPGELAAVEAEEYRRRRQISGYEIIDLIGKGNVASVYRAVQLSMDRQVALKILHRRLAQDPVFVHAYLAEAQAVSRFHHPNIVQGFDAGESNGFYYFAHEHLSGGSMASRLASGKADFSETSLLTYLRQTTSALRHAWTGGVFHGDINPGNLLLDGRGSIKLANLGVPRVAAPRNQDGNKTPGFVRCGPEYAAPEQLEKPETVDARTDIYSLGATFYHLSFGVPPFPGATREEIVAQRRENPMPSFALEKQEKFSGKYLYLIHDMLDPNPDKRPADPDVLMDRLEKFHLPDELAGLARQVRQVPVPRGSAGQSQRLTARATAPNAHPEVMGGFTIRRRRIGRGRAAFWALVGLATILAVAAAAFIAN